MDQGGHITDDLGPAVRREPEAAALGMAFQIIVAPDGVSRRFSFVGQRCLALNGISAEQAMANGQLLYEMILPEHRDAFAAAEADAIEAQKPFDIEVAMRRADGAVRWHRIASMPRRLPDGSTAWDGLQIDVTDRREIAQELEGQRRRLEMAVEATGLGLWEWDVEGGTLLWSDRNKALFGLPPETRLDIERYMQLVHADDLAAVRGAYEAALARGGGDFSVEHRIQALDGAVKWLHTNGRVITENGAGKLVVGTTLDITKRKQAEERRALLMGELAHRAKNGMAVMMALVQQTARTADSVPVMEDLLMARLQSMASAQDAVTETGGRPVALLDVTRRTLRPFDLNRFDIDPALEGVTIAGDLAVGLALLLHEMATNAVKYGAHSTPAGRVAIGRGEAKDGRVAMRWTETGGPEVKTASRSGFGSRVLQTALRPQGGEVEFEFRPGGFTACIDFPQDDHS